MDEPTAGDDGSIAESDPPVEFQDHLTGLVDELERRAAAEIAIESRALEGTVAEGEAQP